MIHKRNGPVGSPQDGSVHSPLITSSPTPQLSTMARVTLALKHAQSCSVFIAREAAGLEHDAAKTTESRCGQIMLILTDRDYVR